ncbi:hypothetical protein MAP00_003606 [Monascus purpureus]|nr:hypothetical protein MAP00_003606 [Monascus purpureus]
MCIAIFSTAHPSYPLIILDNRDEYLHRPTSSLDWWPESDSYVLGSRDLVHAISGTWMGVTKHGKVAVLTNYRENAPEKTTGLYSRGAIVNSWLTSSQDERLTTKIFVEGLISSDMFKNVGGFSLICGRLDEPLAIVSNRFDEITWIAKERGQTIALSNTTIEDRSWPKITEGERLTKAAIEAHVQAEENEDQLIDRLLRVLSTDTLPEHSYDTPIESYINDLHKTIFVSPIGNWKEDEATSRVKGKAAVAFPVKDDWIDKKCTSGVYGTQKQTVILVNDKGHVRYFERTLFDNNAEYIPAPCGDRSFEFTIEK